MPDPKGGCMIVRPEPIPYWDKKMQGITLMSDLHIGASSVDYKLIDEELEEAWKNDDRILINGDVFDMILTRDFKRFEPDVLHSRLRGCRDIINKAVDWGEEIFGDYARNIDMIGVGNHESAVEKHHNVDVVGMLIERLERRKGAKIAYGGYSGFVDYRFRCCRHNKEERGAGKRYVIYYHHGSGGACEVTKGVADLHHKSWIDADVIWLGHKHHKVSVAVQSMSCPLGGHNPKLHEVKQIITGAYCDTYSGQSQRTIKTHGRRSNYAADSGVQPQGKGGMRLLLNLREKGPITVKVLQ